MAADKSRFMYVLRARAGRLRELFRLTLTVILTGVMWTSPQQVLTWL
jgi:hypothetical protein